MPVDNQIYNRLADSWWDEDGFLHIIRTALNPGRFGYFRKVLIDELKMAPQGKLVLDIGCGGGLLAEEFAAMGCRVTGIDPSRASLETARRHALNQRLDIQYLQGAGEFIPFKDQAFDIACCCDVLEHVGDLTDVISETARVLKPGGIYFYDTINRTLQSKLVTIKLFQDWNWTSFMPPRLHDWNMYIKPEELRAVMARHNLENRGLTGMRPRISPLKLIRSLRRRKRGEISYAELGRRMQLKLDSNLSVMYVGYAVKRQV
ncbi:MAG TPA: bifunctional 2-polyprenyl-6-hydroxyphenol methylase/3-demethylubiquinol 3-O-methyltransferase UbiG [Acidobacteriota bacterium]|jgi:2-polyprenyl-6-hydroxyphenyl methylase/3-demethylubiquinone-9 3-methyltransferase